jgi:hypothetical protein
MCRSPAVLRHTVGAKEEWIVAVVRDELVGDDACAEAE